MYSVASKGGIEFFETLVCPIIFLAFEATTNSDIGLFIVAGFFSGLAQLHARQALNS
jgi:hypothetical protein